MGLILRAPISLACIILVYPDCNAFQRAGQSASGGVFGVLMVHPLECKCETRMPQVCAAHSTTGQSASDGGWCTYHTAAGTLHWSAQCPRKTRIWASAVLSWNATRCHLVPALDLFWHRALPHLFKLGSPNKVGLETAPHEGKARKPKTWEGLMRLLFHQIWCRYSSFGLQDILETYMFVCRKRHIKVEGGLKVGMWVVYGVDVFGLKAVEGKGGITRKPHHHISHLCRYRYLYKYIYRYGYRYKYKPGWGEGKQNIYSRYTASDTDRSKSYCRSWGVGLVHARQIH